MQLPAAQQYGTRIAITVLVRYKVALLLLLKSIYSLVPYVRSRRRPTAARTEKRVIAIAVIPACEYLCIGTVSGSATAPL